MDYSATGWGLLVRGQPARFDVRVEYAEFFGAGVREHVVTRRVVVVLVEPADRHGALETVPLVFERRGQRFVLARVRVRGLHGRHLEILETVVREEPVTITSRSAIQFRDAHDRPRYNIGFCIVSAVP